MEESKVVELFHLLDEQTESIQREHETSYLDSLVDTLHTLTHDHRAATNEIDLTDYDEKHIHRAIQLLLLKGMKEHTQANHMMTPEAIALFIGYLVQKLTNEHDHVRIYNPASGTGNLLLSVLDQLEKSYDAYASEIDETLIQIALHSANILQKEIEFFHQDSLRPLLLDPVDVVVSDLPIGYYPDDDHAKTFELHAPEGHAYAHHLFIEQSLQYTKPGGYTIFLIPEFLFTSDQANQLRQFLHEYAHIVGVIQLSPSTFKAKAQQKSILLLRKKSEMTKDVKQPLLVMLPSFKDTNAMENILAQINQWFVDMKQYLRVENEVGKGE